MKFIIHNLSSAKMQAGRLDTTNIINDSNLDNEDEGVLN